MMIEHFYGKEQCNQLDEITTVLQKRTDKEVNEFIIYGQTEFPCMMVLVNKEYACLHYLDEEGSSGFRSLGDCANLDEEGSSVFYTNTDTEEIWEENLAVVPFSTALLAVQEFFQTGAIPTCIEWDEL